MPHLFVDISAHGFGHLAQTAPVLKRLDEIVGDLRLTIRSGLPEANLRQRIALPFEHIAAASDFGYVMHDALSIDRAATAAAYRALHGRLCTANRLRQREAVLPETLPPPSAVRVDTAAHNFSRRVAEEAQLLARLRPDAVLANVSYLPLAGAAMAGIPAMAMCSLNWADLFLHYFGTEPWAAPIHADMLAAYRSATFLRLTPGMPMAALNDVVTIAPVTIAPVASLGRDRRGELRREVGAGDTARVVIVAMGGIPMRLPVENWPVLPDTHWLVPGAWQVHRPDMSAIEPLDWPFPDLLRSVDAVVTKPGYGTFAEAACNGTAVLYQRRDDWPEQDCLIDWLHHNARCVEISASDLYLGNLATTLDSLLQSAAPPAPLPGGIQQAAAHIAAMPR